MHDTRHVPSRRLLAVATCALALPALAGQPPFPNELKYPNIIKPDHQFGTYGTAPGQFIDPMGAAYAGDGNLYLADTGNNRIQVLTADGRPLLQWGKNGQAAGEFVAPQDLALLSDGSVVVADTGNHRVQVFDARGKFLRQWGRPGTGRGEFQSPRSVAVAGERILIADTDNHRVQMFDVKGRFLGSFGGYGAEPGKFNDPIAVTADELGNAYVCDQHNSRIQKFDAQGRYVDAWGKYGSHSGLMATPSDVSYQSGRVFVADLINHRIQAFDTEGNFLFQFGRHPNMPHEGRGRLHYPYALTANPNGQNVLVCEPFENRCQVFSKGQIQVVKNVDDSAWWDKATRFHYGTGAKVSANFLGVAEPDTHAVLLFDISQRQPRLIRRFGGHGDAPGQFKTPEGIAMDLETQRAFVADMGHNRIQVFSLEPGREGDYLASFGKRGTGPGEFIKPGTMDMDRNGLLYIVDAGNSRVQVYDKDLNFVRQWGSFGRGEGQFNMPSDIAIGPDGQSVYILDSYNYRVQVFDLHGNFQRQWGGPGSGPGQFVWPYGMDVAPDGTVYVSDAGAQKIHKFDAKGGHIESFGDFGSDLGQFYKPKGIALSDRGDLYVLDFGNHRGQIFDTTGRRFVAEWGIGELQQMGVHPDAKPRLVTLRAGAGLAALGAFGLGGFLWLRRRPKLA